MQIITPLLREIKINKLCTTEPMLAAPRLHLIVEQHLDRGTTITATKACAAHRLRVRTMVQQNTARFRVWQAKCPSRGHDRASETHLVLLLARGRIFAVLYEGFLIGAFQTTRHGQPMLEQRSARRPLSEA